MNTPPILYQNIHITEAILLLSLSGSFREDGPFSF